MLVKEILYVRIHREMDHQTFAPYDSLLTYPKSRCQDTRCAKESTNNTIADIQ